MRYRLAIDPRKERSFEMWREGWGKIGTYSGSLEWVQGQAARMEEDEVRSEGALSSGDPLALCRLGWHQSEDEYGATYYFRPRHGWCGCWLAYHVGPRPFEYCGRTLGSFDTNSPPWRCSACDRFIDRDPAPGAASIVLLSQSSNGDRATWQP